MSTEAESASKEATNEAMEEDEEMEMEIEEDLPTASIIENTSLMGATAPVANVDPPKAKNAESPVSLDDSDDDEVVCIDDDEKEPPKADKGSVEVIDLVDKKGSVNTNCINYACGSGVDLMVAPHFCLTYYRVKSTKKKQEVCRECCNIALRHFDGLAQLLIQKKPLMEFDIPIRNDLVEIDDSDSEEDMEGDEGEELSEADLDFLRENLEKCVSETMDKLHVDDHCSKSVQYLKQKGEVIHKQFLDVDSMLHDVRKKLDTIHRDLYGEFKVKYEHLPPLDISDVYYPTARTVVREVFQSARAPVATSGGGDPDAQIESVNKVPVPRDLPPKGPLHKPPLKVGDYYYAVRMVTMGSWAKAYLTQVLEPGAIVNGQAIAQTMYCVTIENKPSGRAPTSRLVSGKEVAYAFPSPTLLDVGTRVIATFKEQMQSGEKKMKKEAFYPGIVAEPCSYMNKFRYLIFYDDGYAQYVDYKRVHLIHESSKDVWDDMHIDSRPFIKKYLETYPARPMVKLRKDQTVRTEYNGKWWLTTVTNIDCSLVQMFFEQSNRVEWIYRGSTRLNPMYKEELAATNRNKTRIPRQFNETGPYVQYTREADKENESKGETGMVRAVARKSTSRPIMPPLKNQVQTVPFLPVGGAVAAAHAPPPSKVVYFTPRAQANTKLIFEEHRCSADCKSFLSYDVNKLKGYNPLSKPLLCGWNRVTYKHKGKREINYKAPCGRFIRNMPELHNYLRDTQSEMTVDLFDFDFWVHCLAEFVLEKNSTINKDLSAGLETVAIPVVNYVDNDIPDFCNYSIKREPMEGVTLNVDPEFLCGCDCDDDCEDKMKCKCWQLTLQGLPFLSKSLSPEFVGYSYRRLPEPVITGIYECNSKCKCAKTCLNRVVQNPLQLKLQVFKTHNRGWGIRCLNDIPQGAFICIYAGSILTEQMANEGGKNYGDEYLAELDYIEVVEKMKEDYEDEALMSEEEDEKKHKTDESGDEEDEMELMKEASRNRRRRGAELDDTDFMPALHIPKSKDSNYKTRLRRRAMEDSDKEEEGRKDKEKEKEDDEYVTISDDEDAVREPSSFNPKADTDLDESRPSMYKSVREMFAEDECIYVMDAKVTGNIGRFLNHSCSPNVFVQNVFVDTHDLRFPWVAFFALTYIRAGTELTWNYNYDVGSVPGKVLYCHCSSQECRGRLL